MIYYRIVATVVLALMCLLPNVAGAETGAGGFAFHRSFGALNLDGLVDDDRALVSVKLTLGGQFVGESVLTPNSPEYRFAVSAGGDSARGVIQLRIVAPPQISSVDASISCSNTSCTFSGSLFSWTVPENIIYTEQRFDLTPDLTAVTTVRGVAANTVSVALMAGSMTIYTVSMVQASPNAVITDSLVLGDVRISPGAAFALTISTPLQQGQVFMQAQFQSRNIPPTRIGAAIATWK